MYKNFLKPKSMATMALLVAINIVLSRFLGFKAGPFNFSLAFIPTCIASMTLGPLGGAVTAALADLIRSLLFPQGTYFPLFTVSQFLYGFGYGLMLYNKKLSAVKLSVLVTIQYIILNIFVGSFWYYLYAIIILNEPKAFVPLMASRTFAALVNIPVHIIGINIITKYLYPPLSEFSKKLAE